MENFYGNRLRQLRLKKGYTQIKVQMQTGIDQSDYSKLETGKRYPSFQQAQELSRLYDTSIDYIFGITDEPKPYPRSEIMKKAEKKQPWQ